jgi:hypothetical protein
VTGCSSCSPLRVDHAKAGSNVVITISGNILTATLTEILRVRVPDMAAPVLLDAECTVQVVTPASGVNGDVYVGWAPVPVSGAAAPAASGLRFWPEINVGGTTSEPPGRCVRPCVWIPENTPGDYVLGGWMETGSQSVQIVVNGVNPCEGWAFRG